jgi:hypothetical protein
MYGNHEKLPETETHAVLNIDSRCGPTQYVVRSRSTRFENRVIDGIECPIKLQFWDIPDCLAGPSKQSLRKGIARGLKTVPHEFIGKSNVSQGIIRINNLPFGINDR